MKTNLFQLTLCLFAATTAAFDGAAEPIISEFMAANSRSLADEDGKMSDWIEIHNPDDAPASLAGWYLTDNSAKKTKWAFPAVTLPPKGFLLVFASGKDRRDPARPLHANFSLDADGEHLALTRPDGLTAVSEFAPSFPPQAPDVSYGRAPVFGGLAPEPTFLRYPTPGALNAEPDMAPITRRVTFSRRSGPFAGSFDLVLEGAQAGEHIRYVMAAASRDGAAGLTEPDTWSARYETPLRISGSVLVRAAIFSDDGRRQGPAGTRHYLATASDAFDRAPFQSSLPAVVLGLHGYGNLGEDRLPFPGWVHVFEASSGTPVLATTPASSSAASLRVRGNSSSTFPKKGYNINLLDQAGGDNPEPLLGLSSSDGWALVSPWWYDRAYVRNAVMYGISNRIGRWAPQTRFVEVFYDGDGVLEPADYAGLSLLTERIKSGAGRLELASLSPGDETAPAITGGYLLKVDTPDGDFSFITDNGLPDRDAAAVIVVTPGSEKITPAQGDYIRDYVQRMENALLAGRDSGWRNRSYTDYINFASWVDHHLLQTLSGNLDAIYHSAYFHKDRGGKLVAGPVWDFDRALGSSDPRTGLPETWDPGHVDTWTEGWYGILARDPEFVQAWVDRWQTLRTSELATPALVALCDELAAAVTPEAAARDAARWPDNVSETGAGFTGEIARLKEWLTRRAEWIDQQFVAPPACVSSINMLTFIAPAGAQLAYTIDGSDPRSFGGGIAPNAQLVDGPLTVPATANIHVRSYQPVFEGIHPGSPWSSAVGGADTSPLAPKSRIVNISTRAMSGASEDALLAGVVLEDTAGKGILARAVGPGLAAFGATGVLADPQLAILDASGSEIYGNRGWENSANAAQLPGLFQKVGAFPLAPGSSDSAVAGVLPRGAFTLRVAGSSGQPGICLVEFYGLDANGRTANLSVRAPVGAGDAALIAGVIIEGAAHQRLLLRAVGPSLAAFGVNNSLLDPVLTLHSGTNVMESSADRQSTDAAAAVTRAAAGTGAFSLPEGSGDAAMLVTVPPGVYTIEVKSRTGAAGIVLLELYDVP